MTPEFCNEVSQRYIELYEHITGKTFVPAPSNNLEERIGKNLLDCLNKLA
jgi:phosphoribosylaminoimidazole-succinocarboxamide synthase